MFFLSRRKKLHGVILDHPVDGGDRCQACNAACCKSFSTVELSPGEYTVFLEMDGARTEFTLDGRYYLVIDGGCSFLDGNRCTVYDFRPDVCKRFTCTDP